MMNGKATAAFSDFKCAKCDSCENQLKVLPCDHVFCIDCLYLLDEKTRFANIIVCLICNVKHRLEFDSDCLPDVAVVGAEDGTDNDSGSVGSEDIGAVGDSPATATRRKSNRKKTQKTDLSAVFGKQRKKNFDEVTTSKFSSSSKEVLLTSSSLQGKSTMLSSSMEQDEDTTVPNDDFQLTHNLSQNSEVKKEITSKYYNFTLSRIDYQRVYDATGVQLVPHRIEFSKTTNEIVLLCLSEDNKRSRFTFFDSETLQANESSDFPFSVVDFCIANECFLVFYHSRQMYCWKLSDKQKGYDEIHVIEDDWRVTSLSAFKNTIAAICSPLLVPYGEGESSIVRFKLVENKREDEVAAVREHLSHFTSQLDGASLVLLNEKKFIIADSVNRKLLMFQMKASAKMVLLSSFKMPFNIRRVTQMCVGPIDQSLLTVVVDLDGSTRLVCFDMEKRTAVTLLGSYSDSDADNVNNPIRCCYNRSQSNFAMLHFENFVDKQRLSLFHLDAKSKTSHVRANLFSYVVCVLIVLVAVGVSQVSSNHRLLSLG